MYKLVYTRISGPYGPLILALKGPFLITYIQYVLCNLYYIPFESQEE